MTAGRLSRHAAFLFFLIALAGFARPLLRDGKVLFPADFLRGRAPFSLSPTPARAPAFSRRRHQGDLVQSVVPFQIHGRAEWREGRVPLWIHSQLGGTPFLANDGGVFFPGQLLAALFPRSAVLTVAALFRLALCGAGMILLLRHWGLDPPAQALGAVAFSFSYMMMFWLGWPVTNAPAMLPWVVLGTERVLARPGTLTAAALAAAVGITFLGGQTQMAGQMILGAGALLALRVGFARTPARGAAVVFGAAAGGVALGVALAGVHLVPFLELLFRSAIWEERSPVAGPLPFDALRQWLAPDAWGNLTWLASNAPGAPSFDPAQAAVEKPNGYVGLATLALLPAAFAARKRRPLAYALAGFLLLYLCTIYGVGLHVVARMLPLIKLAYLERVLFLPAFAAAALAGLGLQNVLEGEIRTRMLTASAAACAVMSLAVLAMTASPYPLSRGWIPIASAVALAVTAAMLFREDERLLLGWIAPALVALELVAALGPQNQWSPPREVYPLEAAMRPLTVESGGFLASYDGLYPPSLSAAYGIRDMRAYEPMVTRRWRAFYDRLDPSAASSRTTMLTLAPSPDWSRVAGIDRYLLGAMPSPDAGWRPSAPPPSTPAERITGRTFTTSVSCTEGRAHQLQYVSGRPEPMPSARVVLADGVEVPIHDTVAVGKGTFNLRFARAIPCPAAMTLVLDAGAETTIAAWKRDGASTPSLAAWLWTHPLAAERAEWQGPLAILHLEARPFAWFAERIVVMPPSDERAALEKVAAEIAQHDQWVVLETADASAAEPPAPSAAADAINVERDAPGAIRIDTTTTSARWLVVQESWDPGWHATIDGTPTTIVPANTVFQALPIPAGAHHVELRYRPRAFTLGLLSTALSGFAVLVIVVSAMWTWPRRGRS